MLSSFTILISTRRSPFRFTTVLMPANGYVNNWSNRPHSKSKQAEVISYKLNGQDYYKSIGYEVTMSRLFEECEWQINVCCSTSHKWWFHFGQYGKLPYETKTHFKQIKNKKMLHLQASSAQ